jgi:hypothetical protein
MVVYDTFSGYERLGQVRTRYARLGQVRSV